MTDHGATANGALLLTVREVAELLKVPKSWIYQHTRRRSQDRIPFAKLGHYIRFREADVLAYIERRTAKS